MPKHDAADALTDIMISTIFGDGKVRACQHVVTRLLTDTDTSTRVSVDTNVGYDGVSVILMLILMMSSMLALRIGRAPCLRAPLRRIQ